ncbi:outer membrane protein assembly factor BamB family protein [Streptomyces uncialis]|uniref:outer membrane protein assembly factor BamB family protein n=1 Tax=Streptomyces uncialis TaxID=1048205 RepID=UPI002250FD51|nr:PQQ-binding-like beta-propeller repeat protein [Streptomyces uncialis]MCX4659474.1 PQQ-like beta-propeller repeat protein [Streptomyces uncialis]
MTQDRRPPDRTPSGRRSPLGWVLGPLGGALVVLAVIFHIRGWGSIPGGSCGSRAQACADGTGTLIVLAFVFTFTGVLMLILGLMLMAADRFGKNRLIGLPLAGALLIAWPGWQLTEWLRGPMLDIAWTTPLDRPETTHAQGLWVTGDGTVVRGRPDALIAHDPRGGEHRWSVDAPVRMSLCSMSDTMSQGIALAAYARHEKPCGTVAAIDTDSGRTLWRKTVDADDLRFTRPQGGRVASDGGTAVVATKDGARAFGLRDGKPRWSYRLDDDCAPALVSAGGGRTRIVEVCDPLDAGKVTARVLTLDSGDGKKLRRYDLPTETSLSELDVISADPFVIRVTESDERGLDAVLAFGEDGVEPVVVKRIGTDEELALGTAQSRFPAQAGLKALVHKNTLIAATRTTGEDVPQHVSAYSLRDGARQWRVKAADSWGDAVGSLTVADGRIGVYVEDRRVLSLDPRTGAKQHDHGAVVDEAGLEIGMDTQLLGGPGDGWTLVNADSGEYPPLLGLTPKD